MDYSFASQSTGTPSIINSRELGGYVLPSGLRVRFGKLLRGGSLFDLSDEDSVLLREKFNVVLDFDFRTETETRLFPDKVPPGVKYIWLPTIDEVTEQKAESLPLEAFRNLGPWLVKNASSPFVQRISRDLYTDMVLNEYTQIQYAAFLQTIVNTDEGAIFWHCSQGKDRTGLGSAFILAALGADRELILKDYLISQEVYQADYDYYSAGLGTEEAKVIRTFMTVNPEYFINTLDIIDHKFGSLENYLRGPLCMTSGDFDVLIQKYTQ